MSVLWPFAFLLLLPLLLWHYYFPYRSRAVNFLRLALYIVLVPALAGIFVRVPDRAGIAVAVVDRSRSMPPGATAEVETMLRRLESTRPANSRLGVVSFAGGAVLDKLPDSAAFDEIRSWIENEDASDIAAGLAAALAQIPADASGRIILFSDGRWTGEDPTRLFALAAARNIAVDFRPLWRETANDLAIADFSAPLKAAAGEYYTLNCRIVSPVAQAAQCRIRRGSGPWTVRELSLRRGDNFFSWRDRGDAPGVADYTVEVVAGGGEGDEIPENNRARRLVEIAGRKPLLLLTDSPSGNLAKVLETAGLPVVARRPSPAELTPEKLAGCAGVILENVEASTLGLDGMNNLAGMVKTGALGLFMTGGRSSYAVGGYYRSPLEPVLPVSMEQRQEQRKAALALMVALDRSGSMAMPIGNRTKMDMANLATLEAYKLMMPQDEFGVIAVDSQAHTVIPLSRVGAIVGGEGRIRRIESMGGGIFTYTALVAATNELLKSKALTRHLILFADAADAEEPGRYKELLERTSRAGITVSAVGLGRDTDSDAEFLRDVARRGKGMCYFSDRADELPRIFAQDTFIMAQNTFIDTPTFADYTAAIRTLSRTLGGATEFGGYNRCFARDGAEVLLLSRDEYDAPLAAVWQTGLGRVSALTAEADGEYTGRFAADPQAPALLAALANYVLTPEDVADDYLVEQELVNGVQKVTLYLDPERERDPWRARPIITTLMTKEGETPQTVERPMEWVAPDRLEGLIPLSGAGVFVSTLSWTGGRPIPLAPAVLAYSPEFRPVEAATLDDPALQIRELAQMTGGVSRIRPEELWSDLPERQRYHALTPWLVLLAMLLLLLEVGERRLNLLSRLLPRRRSRPAAAAPATPAPPVRPPKKRRSQPRRPAAAPPEPEPPEAPPAAVEPESSIGDALRQVRKR